MQLVLQRRYKTIWITILRVLPPQIEPVLQQIRSLQVAWILTSDWIKLRRSHAIHGSYITSCTTSLPWAGKTRIMCRFVLKSRTTLYRHFLQQIFEKRANLSCCKTGLNVASKTRNVAIQLVLRQCWKTRSCTFLLPVSPHHRQFLYV